MQYTYIISAAKKSKQTQEIIYSYRILKCSILERVVSLVIVFGVCWRIVWLFKTLTLNPSQILFYFFYISKMIAIYQIGNQETKQGQKNKSNNFLTSHLYQPITVLL